MTCVMCGGEVAGEKSYCSRRCRDRAYYLRHREEKIEQAKAYYREHREEISAKRKERYRNDPDAYIKGKKARLAAEQRRRRESEQG